MAEESPWLSLSEAAQRSGLSREAVRARARRGLVPSRKSNRGDTLVQLPADLLSEGGQGESGSPSTLESDLLAEVAELRERLARAESRLESDLAAAESTRAAQVAAKDEVIAELREQLAWHRRPWWRRLRG